MLTDTVRSVVCLRRLKLYYFIIDVSATKTIDNLTCAIIHDTLTCVY